MFSCTQNGHRLFQRGGQAQKQGRYQVKRVKRGSVLAVVPESRPSVATSNNILSAALRTTSQETARLLQYQPGTVLQVESPTELNEILDSCQDKLIILMCKARTCRPCMAFGRKYSRFAEAHHNVVFLEIFGDDSMDNRRLMVKLKVTGTPAFRFYKNKEVIHSHSGIDEDKFKQFLLEFENYEVPVTA
eukprot:TRINITY_DN8726_c0_g2_i6.p1 TRINITY_DN8726_c0_g2~~TRINITY_DN8726_c0_g2_i6.p1  ORF type:complete len:189 (-),score=20.32 TRINITY_DN8726_c0_g2_i6:305-871(-)